jgi:hypothetical protein
VKYVLIAWAALAAALMLYFGYDFFRKKSPEEKLEALRKEVAPKGGTILRAELGGKPVYFLALDCKVFLLDPAAEKVKQTKVLQTGFYLGFTACMEHSIQQEGEYVIAYLANRAIGAGGGNTSGGTYRSKDGIQWEKKMGAKWRPVDEAQN